MPSAQDSEPVSTKSTQLCNPQVNKIVSNALYLTFNAPKVDDYVYLSCHILAHVLHHTVTDQP